MHQVEAELRTLEALYGVYAEHADVVRQYSNTLWSELDVGAMMDGVAGLQAKLRRLKALEAQPVYGLVAAEISGFADSLPLMRELKSEALRCVLGARTCCWSSALLLTVHVSRSRWAPAGADATCPPSVGMGQSC